VCGAAGDQQAALFGQACFLPGQTKKLLRQGCFTLMNREGFHAVGRRAAHLRRVVAGREDHLCTGGERLQRRLLRPVAAGRAGTDQNRP
jgi:hypothetical protein